MDAAVVIIGGTAGICRRLAERYAAEGRPVVITGRDPERTKSVAAEIPCTATVTSCALDLTQPETIAGCLADVGPVGRLVIGAIERDVNSLADYDVDRALRLVTLKLVGYTEVVHTLAPRFADDASVVLFGGLAFRRPYPGSITVTTVNGGVTGLVHTLAIELAPHRVNGIHPGIVGDSPYWVDNEQMLKAVSERTPLGRPVAMDEVVDAAVFLLENGAVNGINLAVDGGWMLK